MIQGALIGLGAVLPGISGGVLSVVFGIYKPVMEVLANPVRNFKTHITGLMPYFVGAAAGFFGIAKLLAFVLDKYPDPSVCLFAGLITGMFPSLWREAGQKGRDKTSFASAAAGFAVIFILLSVLDASSIVIKPGTGWYLFCGFCLALSIIAPGMSFSTLLMPLGLYTPFVDGIGSLDADIIIPGAAGALATVVCLAKLINMLFERYYSRAFHAITGIVAAATLMIIPFQNFISSAEAFIADTVCFAAGIAAASALDKFNSRVEVK